MTSITPIRRVAVLANFSKVAVRELASELRPWLAERVESVTLEEDILAFCNARARASAEQRQAERPDLVVVLGGDGALLGAVRAFGADPVPTLGINLGRVGFLASTPASRWRETLGGVLAGLGVLEPRLRLEARWQPRAGQPVECVALNEVVIQRGSHQGMLTVSLSAGEKWVTNYRADGVIVATPSGSTAYSLSAGGPVLVPGVDAFVITPISPQGLSNRPLVLQADEELSLTVAVSSGITTLAIDGQAFHTLAQGETVTLRRYPEPYPLYAMPGLDPYRRLRERLGWRGSMEPALERAEPEEEAGPPGTNLGAGGLL
jgi:NAD+ kinase